MLNIRKKNAIPIKKCHFSGRVASSNSDVQKELSQQMEQISEQHQKQLSTLRDEIRGKENQMENLKEFDIFYFDTNEIIVIIFSPFSTLQKLQLSYEKLSGDYEKLKKEETDKSSRLQEMT